VKPLVIIEKYPLPANSGNRQRIWHLLRAVSALGPGDVVILDKPSEESTKLLESSLPGWKVTAVAPRKRSRHLPSRVRWFVRRDTPTALAVMDSSDGVRHVRRLLTDEPRLILVTRSLPVVVASQVRRDGDKLVYDIDDVEDLKLQRIIDEQGPQSGWRNTWAAFRDRIDVGAWRRFQTYHAGKADLVTVCSETDGDRFMAGATVEVIPNGTDRVPEPLLRARGGEPVLFYVGQLAYLPNERAAIRLAEAILPLVRQSHPSAEVHLVGAHGPTVSTLDELDGVSVLGFVDDLSDCWSNASVLVVPLRSGGGTRLKILEAMIRRVPVVSTTIGAEGLDVVDGHHLLIADTDKELAAAVVETIENQASTEARVHAAAVLVEDQYLWDAIEQQLLDVIEPLIRRAPR
jgi:glycosyltransferase involved in cell wall biosynthesis